MRDWREFVSQRLGELGLEAEERTEIVDELADHLAERFLEFRREGLSEGNAVRECLKEVIDWHDFRRKIQLARRKEYSMSNRVRQLWIPGLVSFGLSTAFLLLANAFEAEGWVVRLGHPTLYVVDLRWLFALPLVGAVGAYLSRRAGGSLGAIYGSVFFPVVPFLAAFLIVGPVSLAFDHFIAHNIALMSLAMGFLGLVLAPGVALLAGGLPVQVFSSRRVKSARVAS
jgi:hypothetical protein